MRPQLLEEGGLTRREDAGPRPTLGPLAVVQPLGTVDAEKGLEVAVGRCRLVTRTGPAPCLGWTRRRFVRAVRAADLRPHCEPCRGVGGRATIEIEHPLGDEIQWDWFERRHAPWGGPAYVLLGTLPHSSRVRGVLAPSLDQAHLVEAMDAVLRRLGGTARDWRTDRLATVIVPGSLKRK